MVSFKLKLCILSMRQQYNNVLPNLVPNEDSSKLISSPKWLIKLQRDGFWDTQEHDWHIFIKHHHHPSAQIYAYQAVFINILGEEQLLVKKEVCLQNVSELKGYVCHHPDLFLSSSCTSGLIWRYTFWWSKSWWSRSLMKTGN